MLNIKTMKRQRRLVWDYSGSKGISLFQQGRSGGSVLVEPASYEIVSVPKTNKHPSGLKKVRKRIDVDGLGVVALKLSNGLVYGQDNMCLPITPTKLKKLIDDNFKAGNFVGSEASCKFVLIRSNDLRREMTPNKGDKWLVLRTRNPKAIQGLIKPINEVEKLTNSD